MKFGIFQVQILYTGSLPALHTHFAIFPVNLIAFLRALSFGYGLFGGENPVFFFMSPKGEMSSFLSCLKNLQVWWDS